MRTALLRYCLPVTPNRAFSAEITEVLDKEQVEMRHDEN